MRLPDYILIDVSNMAWRNWHALHGKPGMSRPVLYGMFRDLYSLASEFTCDKFLFCFDCDNRPLRARDSGITKPIKDLVAQTEVDIQIATLRHDLLPKLGYRNLFHLLDYEADDVIAALVNQFKSPTDAIIQRKLCLISSDTDLYQLLSPNVTIWQPTKKRSYTIDSLQFEHGLCPKQWITYKAIVGDTSDGIEGIPGAGDKSAKQYLMKQKIRQTKAAVNIMYMTALIGNNERLIRLPYDRLEIPNLCVVPDHNHDNWSDVMKEIGYPVLASRIPRVGV